MDRPDDNATGLKLDPELVGHDPELADAVESIRQAVKPGVAPCPSPQVSSNAGSNSEDTVRIARVRTSRNDASAASPDRVEQSGEHHVLNVPSGFLTKALPMYWPPPASGTESRRRQALTVVGIVLVFAAALCALAYVRRPAPEHAGPPVATARESSAPSHPRPASPVSDTSLAANRRVVGTETQSVRSAPPAVAEATRQAPPEPSRRTAVGAKTRDKTFASQTIATPQPATTAAAGSSPSERKSWFEMR